MRGNRGATAERVMLDTSVWIDVFKGRTPEMVSRVHDLLVNDRVVTCGPVLFEILQGLRPAERRRVVPLMGAVPRLGFEEKDWERAGDLAASLRRAGHTLPPVDVLVSTLCLRHGVPVLSLDEHFGHIPGLVLA